MTLEEIKALPIHKLMDDNCYLFLWAVMPKLQEALDVMKSWNFTFKTVPFVWQKLNPLGKGIYSGLGSYTCGNAEIVMLGRKGKTLERKRKDIKQFIIEPRSRHSEKPQELKRRIELLLGDIPRVELFARKAYPDGWDYIGEELDNKTIQEVLEEW